MPFKTDADGKIVTQDVSGVILPVFVHADGKEIAFDADSTIGTITRLNGEAKTHRERAEGAETKLKAFEGISDPAAAVAALTIVKNLDDKKLVDAGEVERVKAEAIKAVEEKYVPIVKETETLKLQINDHLVGGAFSQSKFIAEQFAAEGPAGVEIARALFGSQLKVVEGKVVGYDAQGKQLFSRTRPGEFADPNEAIELLVDAYPHKASILKGSGSSGGGAGGGSQHVSGGKSITRAQFNTLSPAEQSATATNGTKITD